MALIYCTLGFGAGLLLAFGAHQMGWLGCGAAWPGWWLPLPVAAAVGWVWRHPPRRNEPLRWPTTAGFVAPPSGPPPGLAPAVALCLVAGFLRFDAVPTPGCVTPADLAFWNLPAEQAFDRSAPEVTLRGSVTGFPVIRRERQVVVVSVDAVTTAAGEIRTVRGQVRVSAPLRPALRDGDPVVVQGRLSTPPVFAEFDYRDYLARQGVHSMLQAGSVTLLDAPRRGPRWRHALADLRNRGLVFLEQQLPEPHAALAAGILLGVNAGIPEELQARFNATSAGHVLVISGSNVALIAAMLLLMVRRVVGRHAPWPVLAGILLYALLVGGDAPVWRAAIMGCLVVVAGLVARRSTALVSLAAAVWLMLMLNPHALWDVGFQLSAAATAGLVFYVPVLRTWLSTRWPALPAGLLMPAAGSNPAPNLGGMVVEGGIMTVAASVLTLPLIAWHFGRLSLIGLWVNVLIVPAQPLILVTGTLGLAAGLAGLPWIPQALLWVAWLGLAWTERIVTLAASLPWADVAVTGYGLPALLLTYAGIFAAHQSRRMGERAAALRRVQLPSPAAPRVLAGLALAVVLVWAAVLTLPDGKLHIHFLDVGQGDAILIVTPSGRQVLVDGGPDGQLLFNQLGQIMPFWDRSLDLVVATHPDTDHIGGLHRLPARFRIDGALETPHSQANSAGDGWRAALADAGVAVGVQAQGGQIDLGDNVILEVLWPPLLTPFAEPGSNEYSLVLRVVYGDFAVLLTGDAGLASEAQWLAQGLPITATVLKAGHHGSAGSTDVRLIAAVNPQFVVISAGAGNRYGHPAPSVLANLEGRAVYRTDQQGRIHFASDGSRVWVKTAR